MAWTDLADSLLGSTMAAFGREVFYLRNGETEAESIQAIFDSAHQSIEFQDGIEYSTLKPILGVRLSDFAIPPAADDSVTIDSVVYEVLDVQKDGQGGATLTLRLQP